MRLEELWRRLEGEDGPADDGVHRAAGARDPLVGRPTRPSRCSCRSCAPPGATTRASLSRCARRWAGGCAARRTTRGWSATAPAARSRSSSPRTSTTEDWLPLAMERTSDLAPAGVSALLAAVGGRRDRAGQAHRAAAPRAGRRACVRRERRRTHEIKRTGTMRLHEAAAAELPLRGRRCARRRTARRWRASSASTRLLAGGRALPRRGPRDARARIHWSFHPDARAASRRRGRGLLAAPRRPRPRRPPGHRRTRCACSRRLASAPGGRRCSASGARATSSACPT